MFSIFKKLSKKKRMLTVVADGLLIRVERIINKCMHDASQSSAIFICLHNLCPVRCLLRDNIVLDFLNSMILLSR